MKVEVCVTSVEAARIAERAGADRLELCAELAVGGVTPSPGLLRAVRGAINIPVHVLIRPRSGDFNYSRATFEQMLDDIAFCKDLGFEGIVTGCLKADDQLDIQRMRMLSEAADNMFLTFHRAFDRIKDWDSALKALEALGVDTVLTSGQARTALEGLPRLETLVKTSKCGIMPGGGIRFPQLEAFMNKGFEAIHLSALSGIPQEEAVELPLNSPRLLREGAPLLPDAKMIESIVSRLRTRGSD